MDGRLRVTLRATGRALERLSFIGEIPGYILGFLIAVVPLVAISVLIGYVIWLFALELFSLFADAVS